MWLWDKDEKMDRQGIDISPREVLVLCLHLVRGGPGHIARVLDLKGSQDGKGVGAAASLEKEKRELWAGQ